MEQRISKTKQIAKTLYQCKAYVPQLQNLSISLKSLEKHHKWHRCRLLESIVCKCTQRNKFIGCVSPRRIWTLNSNLDLKFQCLHPLNIHSILHSLHSAAWSHPLGVPSRNTSASTVCCTSSADRSATSSQHLRSSGIRCCWSDDVQHSAN